MTPTPTATTTAKTIIGIDLGTTFSLASILVDGAPLVIPNAIGEHLTPSAVSIAEDGRVLVGAAARARAVTHPKVTALAFKRDMGTAASVTLGARVFTPIQLSALVLAQLKQDAEAFLGRPIDEAVITVPAYFGELQRAATRDAGRLAGLVVERIINEPTAAAMAYGVHQRDREARIVVLDLGGGTFDVTVLELIEGVLEIQATAGDARLGGEDFTDALAELAATRLGLTREALRAEPLAWARLREAAEGLKRALTDAESARLVVAGLPLAGGRSLDVDLSFTREDVESAWQPLMERVRGPIMRALSDARASAAQIHDVLLVGGATRMPCFARLATSVFQRLPLRALPPDEAVAFGAAIQAALKAGDRAVDDVVVTDIAPFSMGIETVSHLGGRVVHGLFSPILERGTVIPASRVERYGTVQDFQSAINIRVFQGEHSLVRDNTFLGSYRIADLPSAAQGEVSVDVRFTYDLNGLLEVDTHIVGTDRREVLIIESVPGRLSPAELDAARKAMQGLKLDARDALPNTVALSRAEAVYAELTGPERHMLGEAMQVFRAVLDGQNPERIKAIREQLVALTEELRRRLRAR